MRFPILAVALMISATSPVDAQRRPRTSGRGVPCGNSYISPDKVCHIGTSSTASAKPDSSKAAPTSSTASTSIASSQAIAPAGTGLSQAASAPSTVTVNVPPAYAEFLAPLKEMIGFKVILKNPPIDEKWLRNATLLEVHADHLLITAENRRVRIPLASIDLYYADPSAPGELTLAFHK